MRHDREQFGLGADLEAEAEFLAVAVDLLDDQALLVDLDREHRGVAVLVVVLRDGGAERLGEMTQAMRQNVGEANDHRRVQIARLEALHHLVADRSRALGSMLGRMTTWPVGVDGEVALAPGLDLVQIQRLLDLPGVVGGQRFGGCVHVARTITNWGCM